MAPQVAPITGETGPVEVGPGWLFGSPLGTAEPSGLPGVPSAAAFSLDALWVPFGYTEAGHMFEQTVTVSDVDVEEEYEPVDVRVTKRTTNVTFSAAQFTVANLKSAFNGGTSGNLATSNTLGTGGIPAGAITSIPLATPLVAALPLGSTATVATDVFTTTARAAVGATTLAVTGTSSAIRAAGVAVAIASTVLTYDPPAVGQESKMMLLHVADDGLIMYLFRRCLQIGNVQQTMKKAPQKRLLPMHFRCVKPTGLAPWRAYLDATLAS